MRTSSDSLFVLLVLSLLLVSCGGDGTAMEGTFDVEPGARTVLEVRGPGTVTLELDNRSSVELEMRSGDDGAPATPLGRLGAVGSRRAKFETHKTIVFANAGQEPAAVHYRATASQGGLIVVSVREIEPEAGD